ncbi:efflux RND transporter periplasmic adaptor subunit [Enterovirga aerilata]|uniref:Efflux RND transporter periplasmic adaptor subunit n=1 Tax=Enterovirga aerilata TaxID=2730920 RepID=A0A849ICF9_9HYPH|nr:efflux RND transporter periplasmic adaptor subunit [Enterovirga sp. DB1703]NNM73935.1 efflux RND transporter periplasmic adaptor subunit [Enterovirga sp. DB1703]
MKKLLLCLALVGLGLLVGTFVPSVTDSIRQVAGLALPPPPKGGDGHGHGHGHGEGEKEGPEGHVVMTAEQIEAAKIGVAEVGGGNLARKLSVPGTVTTDADRVARVAGKVVGTVAEMRKRLGEQVAKGEVVAVLDSREVAEARSEYFAATTNLELQQTLFEREQALWDKRISAEQQYLRARQTFTEAQLRVELASQKLQALGFSESEVGDLARRSAPVRTASAGASAPVARTMAGLQKYEIRSPLAGRVIERRVDLGAPIGGESEEKELYVVADLSSVWIELSVPSGDLAVIREGQEVAISAGNGAEPSKGKIVFVSPVLNQETRSARVIASVENKDMSWRPGSYVTANVVVSEEPVDMKIPRGALQAIGGEQVVFVRNEKGFEKREVVLGKGDDASVEVVFGLDPGEKIAATNSFVLKAELGKAEAEHVH